MRRSSILNANFSKEKETIARNLELVPENWLSGEIGNGFLYNMVRIIAGTLLEIGQGRMRPEDIPGIISACDRSKAGPTAPAKGLTLYSYEFVD